MHGDVRRRALVAGEGDRRGMSSLYDTLGVSPALDNLMVWSRPLHLPCLGMYSSVLNSLLPSGSPTQRMMVSLGPVGTTPAGAGTVVVDRLVVVDDDPPPQLDRAATTSSATAVPTTRFQDHQSLIADRLRTIKRALEDHLTAAAA